MTLFSPHWYRVAPLKPRLRRDIFVERQVFRDEIWYVVHDQMNGRVYRFDRAAYHIIGQMDGSRTVQQIWTHAAERLDDRLPGQTEVISLLSRLHQADLLVTDVRPDVGEMQRRWRRHDRRKLYQQLKSPLAIRVPLLDPSRFLDRTIGLVAPLYTWTGGALWLLLVGIALVQAALEWERLNSDIADRLVTASNLLIMLAVYPPIKALHELGHAYAVRKWGGQVHEIGVMLLIFLPIPYVDATAANAWPDKWQRALVAAMGIIVELALTAIALLVWISVETGAVSAVAFAVMITAGLSTLLINGNPLLRFDGYYVLADVMEVPNLGPRANAEVAYLVQRYAFGLSTAQPSARSPAESRFMVTYAVAAWLYRLLIGFGIIVLLTDSYFILGAALAIVYAAQIFVLPIGQGLRFVTTGAALAPVRRRAIAVTVAAAVALLTFLTAVPLPYRGVVQGVVWLPEHARIAADTPGFITAFEVETGDRVDAGQTIARLSNDEVTARVEQLDAQVRLLEARAASEVRNGPVAVQQVRQQIEQAKAALALAHERQAGLVIRARDSGTFVATLTGDPTDRFLRKGEGVGYVVDPGAPVVVQLAANVLQADLIRAARPAAMVRFADDLSREHTARIVREVPAARDELPSRALSSEGAGSFVLDPREPSALKALEQIVVFECIVDGAPPLERVGGRVFARIDYGSAPLGYQLYRPLRQLLLKQLRL